MLVMIMILLDGDHQDADADGIKKHIISTNQMLVMIIMIIKAMMNMLMIAMRIIMIMLIKLSS
eukprot:1648598-Lingulodinium_polyedra.AAC.1